ncbi:hypothetical protein Cgig2_025608 [Carnegiea gigantea]|uniref:Uncharacterized protein n=1 Tax=Carnegiea gigantea TaxID=171969 RepID=A0A9Q1Q807_9CARY|nr:hypothetical protein Cgig2_025608 [Carnegiea gigantea]
MATFSAASIPFSAASIPFSAVSTPFSAASKPSFMSSSVCFSACCSFFLIPNSGMSSAAAGGDLTAVSAVVAVRRRRTQSLRPAERGGEDATCLEPPEMELRTRRSGMELERGSASEAVDAMETELDFAFRGGRGFKTLFGQCLFCVAISPLAKVCDRRTLSFIN